MRALLILGMAVVACGCDDGLDCESRGLVRADGMCVSPDAGLDAANDGASGDARDACASTDETCDGSDDDCDGSIDEDALLTFFADVDRDTFGDDERVCAACVVEDCPSNDFEWVVTGGDCDDANMSIAPEVDEVCDGVDNDCDGDVDEGVTTRYYRDADNDTYGDPEATMDACSVPVGYVGRAEDCDDRDLNANPDASAFRAVPRVGGGFDYDCDGMETREYEDVRAGCPGGASCPAPFWDDAIGVPDCGSTASLSVCRTPLGGTVCTNRIDGPVEVRCR